MDEEPALCPLHSNTACCERPAGVGGVGVWCEGCFSSDTLVTVNCDSNEGYLISLQR